MNLKTPRRWEQRWGYRESLHAFKWGVHYKLRVGTRWQHFVVKLYRGSAFGQTKGRRQVYVGWWTAEKGVRGPLRGWRWVTALDRLPAKPTPNMHLPFFPQDDLRDRREERRKKRIAGSGNTA